MDEDPIAAFWEFWRAHEDAIARAIDEGTLEEWTARLGERIAAIHEGLDWELGEGLVAAHYLCISGQGEPKLRVETERWRAAGPADGARFEFHAARPGDGVYEGRSISFGEHAFDLEDFRFGIAIDEVRRRVGIDVHHPAFDEAPDGLAETATWLCLDGAFGEDDVERWLGPVELVDEPPREGVRLHALADVVDALRSAPSQESFAVLQGELDDGRPIYVNANLALKRIDHLLMDLHVELALDLEEPTEAGLPHKDEAERLNAAEDALLRALGHDAVYIGRETGADQRLIHLHVANGGPAMARIEGWAEAQPWHVEVIATLDPSWSVLRRW